MNLNDLLIALDRAGVSLDALDGQVKVQAPKGALNDDLRRALGDHKNEILARLGDVAPEASPRRPGSPGEEASSAVSRGRRAQSVARGPAREDGQTAQTAEARMPAFARPPVAPR